MPGLNRASSGTFWGAIHCGGEHGSVKEWGGEETSSLLAVLSLCVNLGGDVPGVSASVVWSSGGSFQK